MMTRKDYMAIARVLREVQLRGDDLRDGEYVDEYNLGRSFGVRAGAQAVADGMIEYLQADNPRFDAERFREAIKTGKGL